MFYAIPLENRPSWRNPPWMTVLLILVNMLVFWGPQRSEENAQERAARYYAKSSLPALELPAFVDWLERTRSPRAEAARQLLERKRTGELLEGLQHERVFLRQLRAGEVITPAHPRFDEWKRDRREFDAQWPAPFTER